MSKAIRAEWFRLPASHLNNTGPVREHMSSTSGPAIDQLRRTLNGHADAMAKLERNVRNWMHWIVVGFVGGSVALMVAGEGAMGVVAVASVAASLAMVITTRYVAHDGTNAAYMAVGVETARWLLHHGADVEMTVPDSGASSQQRDVDRSPETEAQGQTRTSR